MRDLKLIYLSSLAKIPPYMKKLPKGIKSGKMLQGERFNFQLLFHSPVMHNRKTEVELITDFPGAISIREVAYTPVSFTGFEMCDDDVISDMAGVYPDRLIPLENNCTRIVIRQTKTLWISADAPADTRPGKYSVKLHLTIYPDDADEGARLTQKIEHVETDEFQLEILPFKLPEQRLKVTQWFHPDSLSSHYQLPMWSEEHWTVVADWLADLAAHGTNMILVPALSLILNVAENSRREISQLLIISGNDTDGYTFDFSRFDRYINIARQCGFKYFEISHLFSQWGAAYAPPVVVNGELLFDGTVPGDSPAYRNFLSAMLTALREHLEELNISHCTVFHCSDEPPANRIAQYRNAMDFIKSLLPGFQIIDALNNADIFDASGVDTPVPLISQLDRFKKIKLREKWCYYCCAPARKMPNRFIHFPSSRNRIFGMLLWKHNMDGFLHWGYNFYFEALSRFKIDPMLDPGCDRFYPPGDGFLVYPGRDGKPDSSIRHEVFTEALQDFRLLDLLAQKYGRTKVKKMLSRWCGKISMSSYPRGESAVLALRKHLLSLL
ncbi:MAG: DUF4091 domain-containing protein [Lentisphaeria bacterium]|nr:DUF4091 domain-containing protein [Lentisphaeria bacterium]